MLQALDKCFYGLFKISKATLGGPLRPSAGDNWICKTVQHVIKCSCWTGSQFFSIILINVINVAVSADRAVLDNKIGISFDFSGSVLHQGSARAGGERPGGGARGWGRGLFAFTPCNFSACRAGDEEMGPRQQLQALSMERVGKVALEELEQEGWTCQGVKPLLMKADSGGRRESECSWEARVQFGAGQL